MRGSTNFVSGQNLMRRIFRYRRYQVLFVVGILLGVFAFFSYRGYSQKNAVKEIEALGGFVTYDDQPTFRSKFKKWLGKDGVYTVNAVRIGPGRDSTGVVESDVEKVIPHLRRLPGLEMVITGMYTQATQQSLRDALPKVEFLNYAGSIESNQVKAQVRRFVEREPIEDLITDDLWENWVGSEEHWELRDEMIIAKNEKKLPSSTYLFTKKKFREFRLLLEVRQVMGDEFSKMHSAIAILGEQFTDKGDNSFGFRGPLLMCCQDWGIWDAHGRNRIHPTGHRGQWECEHEKHGKWNFVEVLVIGNRIRFAVNGKLLYDFTDDSGNLKESPIGLQLHSNDDKQYFRFRSIAVSTEPADEMVTVPRKR